VLKPIVEALSFAHANGVLHQDFKPSNVLFCNLDRRPMLTDLGIASLFSDSVFKPELFELGFGTPAYMAPEQWRGIATQQSDIYSVGIVFYEMLTGASVNKTETPLAAAFRQNEGLIPDPTVKIRGLSSDVQHFFFKCLSLEPVNRFKSMEEMKTAMESLVPSADTGSSSAPTALYFGKKNSLSRHTKPDNYEATLIKAIENDLPKEFVPESRIVTTNLTTKTQDPPKPSLGSLDSCNNSNEAKQPQNISPSGLTRTELNCKQLTQTKDPLEVKRDRSKSHSAQGVKKIPPQVAALLLACVIGLAQLIDSITGPEVYPTKLNYFLGVLGSTIKWVLTGIMIYYYCKLVERLKTNAIGIIGFFLVGLLPALFEPLISPPFGLWLLGILFWTLIGIGMALMFQGTEKATRKRAIILMLGIAFAGMVSGLPSLFYSFIRAASEGSPVWIFGIEGFLLGLFLAVAFYRSYQDRLKRKKKPFLKLAFSFSTGCAIALIVKHGSSHSFFVPEIAWLLMSASIIFGLKWALEKKRT